MKLLAPDSLPPDQRRKLESTPGLRVSWLTFRHFRSVLTGRINRAARRTLPYRAYTRLRPLLDPPTPELEIDGVPISSRSDWEFDALLVNWSFTASSIAALLPRLPTLGWIHSTVTGADHFNSAELQRRNILLTLPKAVQAKRVAEFVLAIILADIKNIPEHIAANQKGRARFLTSRECRDITVGIVGFGSIGNAIADLAVKTGMHALAYKRTPAPSSLSTSTTTTHDLNQIFRQTDFIVLALPSTPTTRHMIGREHFQLMKRDASIINVGRGDTLRDDDLLFALQSQHVRRAYLDVLHDELTGRPFFDPPRSHPLLRHPNVTFTGYSASDSSHSLSELFADFYDTLERRMSGRPIHNFANLAVGY